VLDHTRPTGLPPELPAGGRARGRGVHGPDESRKGDVTSGVGERNRDRKDVQPTPTRQVPARARAGTRGHEDTRMEAKPTFQVRESEPATRCPPPETPREWFGAVAAPLRAASAPDRPGA